MRYVLITAPAIIALLVFVNFQRMIQYDNLGGGVSALWTLGALAIGTALWLSGVLITLLRPREDIHPSMASGGAGSGLAGFVTYMGGLCLVPSAIALVFRYWIVDWDPFRMLALNWPFLAWLGLYSGVLLTLGGLALSGRGRS